MSDILLVIYVDVAEIQKAVLHSLLLVLETTTAEGAPERLRRQIRFFRWNLKKNRGRSKKLRNGMKAGERGKVGRKLRTRSGGALDDGGKKL